MRVVEAFKAFNAGTTSSSLMYANCMIFYYVYYFNDMFECD